MNHQRTKEEENNKKIEMKCSTIKQPSSNKNKNYKYSLRWQRTREMSIDIYAQSYATINVSFVLFCCFLLFASFFLYRTPSLFHSRPVVDFICFIALFMGIQLKIVVCTLESNREKNARAMN